MYKIYCIVDNTNNNVYIGKTKQRLLASRISCHKSHFNKKIMDCSSQIILKNENWSYKLLEDDLDEYEAKQREKFYIQNTENCINQLTLKYGRGKGNPERINNYSNKIYHFRKSWGGDPRYENNLFLISADIFK